MDFFTITAQIIFGTNTMPECPLPCMEGLEILVGGTQGLDKPDRFCDFNTGPFLKFIKMKKRGK